MKACQAGIGEANASGDSILKTHEVVTREHQRDAGGQCEDTVSSF